MRGGGGGGMMAAALVSRGDYVGIDWCLKGAGSFAVWDEGEVRCVVGNGFIPALHETLLRTEKLDVPITTRTQAFGPRNPRLGPVDVGFTPGVSKGGQVRLSNGLTAWVSDVRDDAITIDANHPLAGKELELTATVREIYGGETLEYATFAGGCFWGLELAYQREPGVAATWVGYTQGETQDPTYESVCSGTTGHTEAVQVAFDPELVSYRRLCDLFWDRLGENRYALNQVGNDRGTQYRHGIYYHSDRQREMAQDSFPKHPDRPIVTELKKTERFWHAEDYHQHYLQKGGQTAKKKATDTIRCYG
ncbi:hypothetical protein CTAYLR_000575 [Chrysophaeum taylorii]|uniref:peptide-methionine (S)-S-oxide reductase n=1 Tax=Chrysophaeum taylorii TaxID=2483200 RepID=A0AAD7UH74_9STRA|nr:hypothetical protein CTAYLR_000575 [Chrysophaeum taylorii]